MESQAIGQSAVASNAVPPRRESPLTRRVLLGAAAGYVAATAVAVAVFGHLLLPRDVVFVWLMGGLLILSLNNPRRWMRGMIVDWLPFIVFLFAYDYARSIADTTGFGTHYHPPIDVDHFLFGTPIPTIWLQHHFYHPPHPAVYDYAAWVVYLTHFFGTLTLAAILWRFAYPLFKKWRTLVIWVSVAGFTTYVLFRLHRRGSPRSATSSATSRRSRTRCSPTRAPRRSRRRSRTSGSTRSRPCRPCTRPSR